MNARQALALAVEGITPQRGHVRITASFENGRLSGPIGIIVFRQPPGAIAAAADLCASLQRRKELLEHAAQELDLANYSTSQIVAEYDVTKDGPQLKWVDVAWQED